MLRFILVVFVLYGITIAQDSLHIFCEINGKKLFIPIPQMSLSTFLDRSICYTPKDIIRDGLPNFGSKRDDWKEGLKPRIHKGIDIYIDSSDVQSVADGIIEAIGKNKTAGLWVKVDHSKSLKTVYVHLADCIVAKGKSIRAGQIIGHIRGPRGNAIEPQLHFEVELNGIKIDPFRFLKSSYSMDSTIILRIQHCLNAIKYLAIERDSLILKHNKK